MKVTKFELWPSPFKCIKCEPSNYNDNMKLATTILVLIIILLVENLKIKIHMQSKKLKNILIIWYTSARHLGTMVYTMDKVY